MGARRLFSAVRWVLRMQLLAIALITSSVLALWGWPEAKSALLGGLAAFLPNAYFAVKFGSSSGDMRPAKDIIKDFYLGETIKLIITAVLFILILQLPDIMFMPLFAGFGSVLMVFWFALLARGTE
jgi:ATP synthase protein I